MRSLGSYYEIPSVQTLHKLAPIINNARTKEHKIRSTHPCQIQLPVFKMLMKQPSLRTHRWTLVCPLICSRASVVRLQSSKGITNYLVFVYLNSIVVYLSLIFILCLILLVD